MGPRCRMAGSCPLALHSRIGTRLKRCKTSRPSTAVRLSLRLRSLLQLQLPPFDTLHVQVGLPLRSTPRTKRAPPVERTANWLAAVETNGVPVDASAKRKEPPWAAATLA